MASIHEDRPRLTLEEFKVTQNRAKNPTVLNEPFTIKKFKKRFNIVIIRNENYEMEFDLIGIHPFLANAFRRLMLSDVPSMAIEKVYISNNSSIIPDEVLAQQLGLINLKADPRLFDYVSDDGAEHSESNSLEFELKIKCTHNKETSKKDSSRAEDIYKNSKVFAHHIKWIPIGNQKEKFKESDVGPIDANTFINVMRPGQELDMRLVAIKSCGRDHAKFQPVATAFYRLLPDIQIVRPVEGEAAYRLQKSFSPGVINVKQESNGKKYAVVNSARYDMGSRNVYMHDDLKDAVVMTKIQDHFIFTIESVGALQPDVIFREAVNILKNKCISLLDELNSS